MKIFMCGKRVYKNKSKKEDVNINDPAHPSGCWGDCYRIEDFAPRCECGGSILFHKWDGKQHNECGCKTHFKRDPEDRFKSFMVYCNCKKYVGEDDNVKW